MRTYRIMFASLAYAALLWTCSPAAAIDEQNVLVLYNSNPAVPESFEIASYYQQVHPGVTLLGLNLGTATTISASDYLTNIRAPVLSALTPQTDVIVTTKGMPLKIHNYASQPASYTDPYGNSRIVFSWKTVSSLESELTKIDYISTDVMMGDQSFNQNPVFGDHFTENMYYKSTDSFSAANFTNDFSMRLTSRLDGFSVQDVTSAIDRAQNAYVGPLNTPQGPYGFLVDALDPTAPKQLAASTMTNLAENVLPAAGMPLTYEKTGAFQATSTATYGDYQLDVPVIGYSGHGDNQPATPDLIPGEGSYIVNSQGLQIALADGAVFNSWESYNAQSFTFGGNSGHQGLIAEWLAKGGTAAVGNVDEPEGSPSFVFNEDQMFSMLLDGKTLAEAAWSSARQLSHVNTVVGDPLMTWKMLLPGDANMDGVVDIGDLAVLGNLSSERSIDPNTLPWLQGDFNGDGHIDMRDMDILRPHFGESAPWASSVPITSPKSPVAMALLATMHATPEPSSMALAMIGLVSLAAYGWQRYRKVRASH